MTTVRTAAGELRPRATVTAPIGTSRWIEAEDGRRYAFADHNCFACGDANPIGMHLHIELGEGEARTTWTAGDDFVGWEDKVHGGMLATLLDEVMAWAPSSYDSWAVTAEMNLRYRTRRTRAKSSARTAGSPSNGAVGSSTSGARSTARMAG